MKLVMDYVPLAHSSSKLRAPQGNETGPQIAETAAVDCLGGMSSGPAVVRAFQLWPFKPADVTRAL